MASGMSESGMGSGTEPMMPGQGSGNGSGEDSSSELTVIVIASVVAVAAFLLVLLLACVVVIIMVRRVKGRRGEWTVNVPGMDTRYKGKKLNLHEGLTNAMYACKSWAEGMNPVS